MDSPIRKGPPSGKLNPPIRSSGGASAGGGAAGGPQPAKKQIPPDQTHAENFYYLKQMQTKTTMVVVLTDGEILRGVIEWYDKTCIKLNRTEGPNLLLYKSCIRYMYKGEEDE